VPPSWPGDRNDYGLEAAKRYPNRFAVMGRIPLKNPQSAALLQLCERRSTTLEKLQRDFDGELNTLVLTALQRDPQQRYASAEAFAARIDQYLSRRPSAPAPPPAIVLPSKSHAPRYALAGGIAVIVIAAAVWIALSFG